jgi:hypothetical protein
MTKGQMGSSFPLEQFEIVEIDGTAFLTDEERSWPVVTWQQSEEFIIEEPLPPSVPTTDLGAEKLKDR